MENLLIGLFFIVVIVMALRSSRSQRKNKSVDHSDPLPPPTWQPTQRKYPNPIQNVQMQPFKREIAHTLIEPRVLTGTAFVTDGDTITINKTQVITHPLLRGLLISESMREWIEIPLNG